MRGQEHNGHGDEQRIARFERHGQERREGDHASKMWREGTDARLDILEGEMAEVRAELAALRADIAELTKSTKTLVELMQAGNTARSAVDWLRPFLLFVAAAGGVYITFKTLLAG